MIEIRLLEEIDSYLGTMNEVYIKIRRLITNLASLRRRETQACQRYLTSGGTLPNNLLSTYADKSVLAQATLSFANSMADNADQVSESLNVLHSMTLEILSLFELFPDSLKEGTDLLSFSKIGEILTQMSESIMDEAELISYWAKSCIINEIDFTGVAHNFELISSCLPSKMMAWTLWTEEVYPTLIQLKL